MGRGLIYGLGGLAGLLAAMSKLYSRGASSVAINPADWSGWVWPVPVWDGRVPSVSDGFYAKETPTHRKHPGVDVTFRKLPTDPKERILYDATPNYISPAGTPILAPGPGKIWAAKHTERGLSIQIDHGRVGSAGGVNSYLQHLATFVKPWQKGDIVNAGDVLGTMGYDPSKYDGQHFRHLHFELWFPVQNLARDPVPYMRHWRKITLPTSLPVV